MKIAWGEFEKEIMHIIADNSVDTACNLPDWALASMITDILLTLSSVCASKGDPDGES